MAYFDDYLICSQTFTISLAPSEILENRLERERQILQDIKKIKPTSPRVKQYTKELDAIKSGNFEQAGLNDYLNNKIAIAKANISDAQQFKWFRSNSEREWDINTRRREYHLLIDQVEVEKRLLLDKEINLLKKEQENKYKGQLAFIKKLELELANTEF